MRILFPIFLLIFVIGCSKEDTSSYQTESTINQNEYEVIASNLEIPWEIAKLDDTIYISERTGSIVQIKEDNYFRQPVRLEKGLSNQPEAGLLGIAFPSNFTNKAFAYYSYVDGNDFFQRVVEIQLIDDHWQETNVLLDKIPGGKFHQGGRIKIGPDQKLYITTGDATVPELAQDVTSLAGKILRMNIDGTIPSDNPIPNNYVYSYGHRNPQGLAWDSEGNLYASEHGSSAHDELNHIQKGKNYGWPIIQGDETKEGMLNPIVHSHEKTWAPSGMALLEGKLYFASLRGEGIRVYDLQTNMLDETLSELGRVRDVLATNQGLYVITNNTDGRGNPYANDDRLIFIPIHMLR
ncbi:PQQ-dependent sugar dehydrogenase [Paucisalibacillus sp. EB02]|uniref:PQQ-dependent sugar dehydrogenase n=1 Tax=Paucisalibacillus sp. EB02 TaxID=1347087 RepID=UPI0005A95A7B